MEFLNESEQKRGTGKHAFRSQPKPTERAVEEATKEIKDRRKKRGRTIRFDAHEADMIMTAVDQWAAQMAAEKGREIGAKMEPFPANDVYVWCIKRGLRALEEGERPQSVVSGSLIIDG